MHTLFTQLPLQARFLKISSMKSSCGRLVSTQSVLYPLLLIVLIFIPGSQLLGEADVNESLVTNTVYVAHDGLDTNAGTMSSPLSLQQAIDDAGDTGDTKAP